jgi:hypothetical protein
LLPEFDPSSWAEQKLSKNAGGNSFSSSLGLALLEIWRPYILSRLSSKTQLDEGSNTLDSALRSM